MTHRIVLLVTSPRLPAGLLTAAAWDWCVPHPVFAAADERQVAALRAAGVDGHSWSAPGPERCWTRPRRTARLVWLAGPAGDEDLARELGLRLAREPGGWPSWS